LEVFCGACWEAKGRGMVVNEAVADIDIEFYEWTRRYRRHKV
jgi:hypothetical protein